MTTLSSKNYLNYIKIILHIIDWSRNYYVSLIQMTPTDNARS